MKNVNPMLLIDFYKAGHVFQYPPKTEVVYSTWTPRGTYIPQIKKIVVFGFQGVIKEILMELFNDNFFDQPKEVVVESYRRVMKHCLFVQNPDVSHIEALHDLGYLPIRIKALKEGSVVNLRTPVLTIENTKKEFYWLTNALETLFSCESWQIATSATIANEYRKILEKYAMETVGNTDFVQFQGHDFSFRGHTSWISATKSGSGHALSFVGTDTVPSILYLEEYYNANIETELIGCSVPATEHSVMCAGGKEDEYETYRRLIEDVYPSGFVSIVSDTWDLWNTHTDILPRLKDKIMSREGKVVIRPDSGDPVDIICGSEDWTPDYLRKFDEWKAEYGYNDKRTPAEKGVIELLWDIFGGTVNEQGYKVLDPHIGAIYGDSITLERAEQICERLKAKGFASTNIVFGIGSYTYQYQTRDTFGWAVKSTAVTIDGVEKDIFKDPVTDSGTKKSAVGRVAVIDGNLVDGLDSHQEAHMVGNQLETIFLDGKLVKETSLSEIRAELRKNS